MVSLSQDKFTLNDGTTIVYRPLTLIESIEWHANDANDLLAMIDKYVIEPKGLADRMRTMRAGTASALAGEILRKIFTESNLPPDAMGKG